MKEIIEWLIKEREQLQKNLAHAIQNEKNTFSNDWELRVKRYREEIKLNSELLEKFIVK